MKGDNNKIQIKTKSKTKQRNKQIIAKTMNSGDQRVFMLAV